MSATTGPDATLEAIASLCGRFLEDVTPLFDAYRRESYESGFNAKEIQDVVAFVTKWEPLMRFVGIRRDTALHYNPDDSKKSIRQMLCACGATETRAMEWMEKYYPSQCPWLFFTPSIG